MTAPRAVLLVDGADLSCFTLADVRVTVGRETVYEQPEAATLNAQVIADNVTSEGVPLLVGARCELWVSTSEAAPPAWDAAAVLWADPSTAWDGAAWEQPDWRLFAGRITDIGATQVPPQRWEMNVTAAGPMAELARTPIGDQPWPVETDSARIHRILGLAGYDTTGVDPAAHGPLILARDVDRQPALKLLQETAQSGNGLLWEDHANDRLVYQPRIDRGGGTDTWDGIGGTWDEAGQAWDDGGGTYPVPHIIDECAVLLDPWTWSSQVGQLVTWCEVKYGDPERVAESGSTAPPVYGRTITTQLASSGDAQALADTTVYTRAFPRWSAPRVELHANRLDAADWSALPGIVVGGSLLQVATPPGSPLDLLNGYLEGWTHRLNAVNGVLQWFIELQISDRPLTEISTLWDTADPLTWDTAHPDDTWNTPRLTGATG